jgi:hypothetical protein
MMERVKTLKEIADEVLNHTRALVMKEMFGEDVEEVVPSENIWNAWVVHKDGFHSFSTGGNYEYWMVIREALFEAFKKADEIFNDIIREWDEKVGKNDC